ncbi:MAG: beta-phosphoglucomutase [Pseudopedobacter saltans]|uniref:Beta-phosphoglucomutase n=1 Tax=Pseudopedobacter saltans TaxID=151895 RepID=A0A2W5F1P0_9SPHI|nr:MAG: beta-phosphoglucomutase [Pseudopedobacter saltans]
MIKGCLFDLDGVIVDTAKFHFLAWQRLAKSLGIDFNETQNEELKGVSRIDSLKKILAWGKIEKSEEEIEKLATQKNEWYVEMINTIRPGDELPGARSFLQDLRNAGLKIALGSASKNAGTILDKLNIVSLFDAVIDGNQVKNSKPDPEVFLKGAEALGLESMECVVFEDALAGIEAAKAGKMYSIGIGDPSVLGIADKVFTGLNEIKLNDVLSLDK